MCSLSRARGLRWPVGCTGWVGACPGAAPMDTLRRALREAALLAPGVTGGRWGYACLRGRATSSSPAIASSIHPIR